MFDEELFFGDVDFIKILENSTVKKNTSDLRVESINFLACVTFS